MRISQKSAVRSTRRGDRHHQDRQVCPSSASEKYNAPAGWSFLSGEQVGTGRGEPHEGTAFMSPQPALGDRVFDTDAVFGRGATSVEKRVVDQLDMDAAVLHCLGRVGDLNQLARGGVGISEVARFDESHGFAFIDL
jgi:hypothetical protein